MLKTVIFIAFCLSVNALVAQPGLSTKSKRAIELYTEADNYRVRGQFAQAIELLNEALKKDKEFVEAWYRLGLVYMSRRDFPSAIENFERGLSLTNDVKKQKIFWFDLGEAYFMSGEYEKAGKFLTDFLGVETQHKPKIEKAKMLMKNVAFAAENKSVSGKFQQRELEEPLNQFAKQYFPVLTADQEQLIFTRRLGFSDEFDEDLVTSHKDAQGKWSEPEAISKNINTSFNEGTCTISADGRKLIFTACTGWDGFGSCDLFESVKTGEEWSTPRNLGPNVNTAEWESQPSLSADGRTLYFVSDRRGGYGRRDVWVSTLAESGEWSRAKNVGRPVNTVNDEMSPFIHVNNRSLFFATNGLAGFGGYDVFYSERDSAGNWQDPVNMGAPLNNAEDQFALFITADGNKGYYAHEVVSGGHATSKLMEIAIPEETRIRYKSNYVKGRVTDRETHDPLKARIELINLAKNEIESIVESDSVSGQYLFVLTQGSEYALYVNKKHYLFRSLYFNYSEVKNFEPITLDIELDKAKEGSIAVLQNIFFDHDKYELKEKSLAELNNVKRFLDENSAIRVEISGHTDNSGTPAYNKQLSERRAQAVYNYFISNGVSASRLIAKGYGPDKPVAENTTEEGRQKNRRIEFKLIR